ncbi:MAG TPA: ATP-binding protein [Aggregatilinea sp.]|uniref:GAF domain-containing sensor histidine kinase n=1 Tax=Aggregatilinea sp. TaxID=2806333 RepID=UPI002BD09B48|nr:ATP-binding protein [Aggregatilinea sp.]HML20350.1 ATP-binding protein [Aggregatilinea sp.]
MPYPDRSIIEDKERLALLQKLSLLDSPPDPAFDRLTRLASRILNMPISLVSLIDIDRQFFKSVVGLPDPWATLRETPLTHSFCQHVMATGEPLIVEDARDHPLVYDNPAIQDLNAITYAGMPLTMSNGVTLGSFCVVDSIPHRWQDDEIEMLHDLAQTAITELELRAELIEHERTLREMRHKEQRLNAILTSAPIILYSIDLNGYFTFSRGNALENLGFRSNERVGISALDAYAHSPEILALLKRALKGESFTATAKSKGRVFSASYRPLYDEGNELTGTIGVATDITDLAKVQTKLNNSLNQIKVLEQLKSEMLRMAAHDLRNPLNGVMGYAELLMETDLDPEQIELVGEISTASHQMARIISDILSLEKVESVAQSSYHDLDIRTIISQAYQENEATARRSHQAYFLSLPPVPTYVHGDRQQLLEAINNLIGNAIKYTPDEGRVSVRVYDDNGSVVVEVEDSGYGVPANQQSKLFTPFFRARSAETCRIDGTGLGLSLVKKIVERHNGNLRFESEHGKGSLFGFALPRVVTVHEVDSVQASVPTA